MILLGLGIAFVGICVTSTVTQIEQIASRYWPLVPGALLLAMGVLLVMQSALGCLSIWPSSTLHEKAHREAARVRVGTILGTKTRPGAMAAMSETGGALCLD